MNKISLILFLFIFDFSFGQSHGFKYQAVVRDDQGVLLYNQLVSVKSSILSENINGQVQYSEIQTKATNEFGVLNLNIGEGSVVTGNLSSINWGSTTFFLKTELDISGGNNFQFMGTSQILSVPLSMFAFKAGSSVNDQDTNATNEIQFLSIDGDSLRLSSGNAVYINGLVDFDSNPDNELQTLSISGDTLKISSGNSLLLSDNNSYNEIQTLSIIGDTLRISNSNNVVLSDNNPTNEIQTLSIIGDSLKISSGNSIKIKDHYVGELWGGGVVFYVYRDTIGNTHGLIVSRNDIADNIISLQQAVDTCENYSYSDGSGFYDDWELPSRYELIILLNKYVELRQSQVISPMKESDIYYQSGSSALSPPQYYGSGSYWSKSGSFGFFKMEVKECLSGYSIRAIRRF